MPRLAGAILIILALFLPAASGAQDSLRWDGTPVRTVEVASTSKAQVVRFESAFLLPNATGMYLKVVPQPGNPTYRNGTPESSGWWTTILLDGTKMGSTNGTSVVELGRVENGTHTISFEVRAPAGALKHPMTIHLDYSLVTRGAAGGQSSGGRIAPSLPFEATIVVIPGTVGADLTPVLWAVPLAVAATLAGVWVWKRRHAPQAPKPDEEDSL
jgi:hypothetical protein